MSSRHSFNIAKWLRYVDNIFLLWSGTETELTEFVSYLNSMHPFLKFSLTKSLVDISFLDVKIWKNNEKLETTLFAVISYFYLYL